MSIMINPELKKGDIVVLLTMDGESNMGYGEKGEVLKTSVVFGHKQYKVKWENGSTLDLLEDADKWMLEDDFIKIRKKRKTNEVFRITKKQLLSQFR